MRVSMRYGPSDVFATISSALLVADCVLIRATISEWAETDGILGARALPQWWYAIHQDSSGASGVTFFSGHALAGAVAGFGLALPIVFDRTRMFRRRAADALMLTVVAALTWTAIFHERWVACRFGIGAPGAAVEIPPPAT